MPSLFSLSHPITLFQLWFVVYLYLFPFLLYATWASLAMMDLSQGPEGSGRAGWGVFVVLVPWAGGAWYLLRGARAINRPAALAIVWTGVILWVVPLVTGVWLAGGALGPKALS